MGGREGERRVTMNTIQNVSVWRLSDHNIVGMLMTHSWSLEVTITATLHPPPGLTSHGSVLL